MKKHKILYISDVNASESLFHAQVLPHVNELKKYRDIQLMCLSRGEEFDYDYSYKSVPGDYFVLKAFLNFLKNKRNLFKYLQEHEFSAIYSRGYRGGVLGALIKKYYYKSDIKLINDVRGDALDEHKSSKFRSLIFMNTTRFIFKYSNVVFFVSSYLRNKYVSIFNFNGASDIFPTFVPDGKFNFSEKIREEYRSQLGFCNDDIVLLYSGNMARWQNVDLILNAFENSETKNLKLLFLSKDQTAKNLINNNKRKDEIMFLSVDYNEIQNYYFSSDYGLLIRDDIDTNRCSAPTKFSEYINSGLILITTDIKADYVDFLKNSNVDKILLSNKFDLLQVLNKLKHPRRNEVQINTLNQIVTAQIKYLD